MKKIISFAMSTVIVAVMSISAFAAEDIAIENKNTTVNYTVVPTYTVTIPENIKLTEQDDKSYAGNGTISVNSVRLKKDETLDVKIDSNFELSTGNGATQKYIATKQGETTPISNGDTIASFIIKENQQSVTINYSSPNPKYAGEYSDTVIFTFAINNLN